MTSRLLSLACAVGGLFWLTSAVDAASPRLSSITPRGIQRGVDAELTFSGSQLEDAEEIMFFDSGFTVTKIEAVNGGQVKVKLKAAPDCRLGEHVAHVRTSTGLSDYRTFFVGQFPIVEEKEPNSEFESPQPIAMNVTVHGVANYEDVDYYVVEAKKGQRISAEIEGMRLGGTMFDPYVAILDSKRFELATADDTPLFKQDPCVSVIAPADGKYVIEVREAAYQGSGSCSYRLHVGTFPRPTAVYPAGGKAGEETAVKFLGDPSGEILRKLKLPATPTDHYGVFADEGAVVSPSPNPFRVVAFGNALEVEPNNTVKDATKVELPNAFNGIISEPKDIDFFRFSAKKGQVFEVECFARRLSSGLDPVMYVYNSAGAVITGNDDSRGPDSYFRFAVPADGEYLISVTDHLGRGQKDFVYRVEFHPVVPSLTLGIPRVERYGQYKQQIPVPRGGRFATLISASRVNFGGELQLDGKDLPPGITMICEPMAANQSVVPVVFEATADAPDGGKLVNLMARHVDPKLNISGGFSNRADFIVGAPGQSLYVWKDVDRLAVAAVDELPFEINIVEPKVPIVRNGSMQLKIVATRKPGFDAPIQVEFPYLPPGLSAATSVTIPAGQNEVLYPLNANGGAEIKKWKVYAIGGAPLKDTPERTGRRGRRRGGRRSGLAWTSSKLTTLEIAAPFVTFNIARTACEQGQETEFLCKIQQNKPFPGDAKVRLIGLPFKVTTTDLTFNKDTKEIVFKIKTDAASPAGRHGNVFAEVTITDQGEPVVHANVGTSELRIDKPLPKPVAQPMPMPMPMPAAVVKAAPMPVAPPPMKRLSRLEQLRLEAQQKAQAGK